MKPNSAFSGFPSGGVYYWIHKQRRTHICICGHSLGWYGSRSVADADTHCAVPGSPFKPLTQKTKCGLKHWYYCHLSCAADHTHFHSWKINPCSWTQSRISCHWSLWRICGNCILTIYTTFSSALNCLSNIWITATCFNVISWFLDNEPVDHNEDIK